MCGRTSKRFILFSSIPYDVPERTRIRIDVYNSLGQCVAVLVDGIREAGTYEATWDGRTGTNAAASGIYLIRMQAGVFQAYRKIIYLE